jgi:general secretion pathway protein F
MKFSGSADRGARVIYVYKALNNKGEEITDTIDAANETAARQKIRKAGLYPVKISEQGKKIHTGSRLAGIKNYAESINDLISKSSARKQVGLFSRQMATLLKAGMPLLTSLNNIIEQIDNRTFKNIIIDVREKIEEGLSFSNALSRHSDIFSEIYINMIRVGENLGSLDEVLARLAEMEQKKVFLLSRIRAALWYPVFMLTFSMLILIFLLVKIIPTISAIFVEQKRELPLPTKIVLGLSNFLTDFWILIPLFFILIWYLYKRASATPEGRRKIDEYKMKLPLAGRLYNKLIVYRFTMNLGMLMTNRVDLLKCFEIVKKIVNNRIIEEKIERAAKNIQEGASIAQALKKDEFLPKLVIGMISAGEASDKVDEMLVNIGNVYENDIDMLVTSLTGIIEPLIIILMGIIIGMIVLSVMMPIMEMNLMVQ